MKEYRVDSKIRNNLLLSKIESAGYSSGAIFAKQAGISYNMLLSLVNLKKLPIDKRGNYHKGVESMCTFLNVMPSDIFNFQQMNNPIVDNNRTIEISSDELINLDFDNNPLIAIEDMELKEIAEKTINQLTPKQQDIVKRHTMDGETFESISKDYGVTTNRIMQIHQQALRILRKPKNQKGLKDFCEINRPILDSY